MKLTCALVAGLVEKQHLGIRVFTSSLDALITALVDNALELSLEVSYILQQLIFFAVVVSVVETDKPPGTDALELTCDEALDSPFQPLGLLSLLSLILSFHCSHLSFFCFFSRRGTDTNPLAPSTSLLFYGLQLAAMRLLLLNPPSEHCRR